MLAEAMDELDDSEIVSLTTPSQSEHLQLADRDHPALVYGELREGCVD